MADNRTLSNLVAAVSASFAATLIAGPAVGDCAAPSTTLPAVTDELAITFGASGAGKGNALLSMKDIDLTNPVDIAIGAGTDLVDPNGVPFKGGLTEIKALRVKIGGTGIAQLFGDANDPASMVAGTPGTNGIKIPAGFSEQKMCGSLVAAGFAIQASDVLHLEAVSGAPTATVEIIGTVAAA